MSMLTRLRGRTAHGHACTRIGAAVVVHAANGVTDEARAFATTLPSDPARELVVADLPADSPPEVWTSFASALPKGRRPLRVVPATPPRDVAPYVWQWLADRVGRPVLAPHGVVHARGGALFPDGGWLSFEPSAAPVWHSKRFPCPAWDSPALAQERSAGFRAVAEPLPSGVWLRPDLGHHGLGGLGTARTRLTSALPCLPDAPLIVLGAHGATPLDLSDVVAYLRSLPPVPLARFVPYGELRREHDGPVGQELADALGIEVVVYTGIPTGSPDALDVLALRPDGSLGVRTFAQAFAYRPGGTGRLCAHRPPGGLAAASPGVYWCSPGVVAEVVRAGLWVRPAARTDDPAGVRATAPDPLRNLVLHEDTDQLQGIAEGMLARLDEPSALRPCAAPTGSVPPDTDLHWLSRMLETTVLHKGGSG